MLRGPLHQSKPHIDGIAWGKTCRYVPTYVHNIANSYIKFRIGFDFIAVVERQLGLSWDAIVQTGGKATRKT